MTAHASAASAGGGMLEERIHAIHHERVTAASLRPRARVNGLFEELVAL